MLELLLEKNIDIEYLVKIIFFTVKKANLNTSENYYTCDVDFVLLNTSYNVIFPHDENNMETIDKYIRRFQ